MTDRSNIVARPPGAHQSTKSLGERFVHNRRCLIGLLVASIALPTLAGAAVNENFDGVTAPALPAGWTTHIATGAASDVPWATRDDNYAASLPNAAWIDDLDDYADISLVSPTLTLPASGSLSISFQQSYSLWAPDPSDLANGVYNGGVLEISINGGAFEDIVAAGGSFTTGGYNVQLDPGFDNPLQTPATTDRSVWGADSSGFVPTTATLPTSAAGASIVLRWRLGTEGGGRGFTTHSGWWIDDFNCDQCTQVIDDTIFKNGFDGT